MTATTDYVPPVVVDIQDTFLTGIQNHGLRAFHWGMGALALTATVAFDNADHFTTWTLAGLFKAPACLAKVGQRPGEVRQLAAVAPNDTLVIVTWPELESVQ